MQQLQDANKVLHEEAEVLQAVNSEGQDIQTTNAMTGVLQQEKEDLAKKLGLCNRLKFELLHQIDDLKAHNRKQQQHKDTMIGKMTEKHKIQEQEIARLEEMLAMRNNEVENLKNQTFYQELCIETLSGRLQGLIDVGPKLSAVQTPPPAKKRPDATGASAMAQRLAEQKREAERTFKHLQDENITLVKNIKLLQNRIVQLSKEPELRQWTLETLKKVNNLPEEEKQKFIDAIAHNQPPDSGPVDGSTVSIQDKLSQELEATGQF